MEIIDIPTQQTTAVTNGVLAGIALVAALSLCRFSQKDRLKHTLWLCIFGLLALASILGAVAHGIKMPNAIQKSIWHPLYLSLGLLVAIFMVAAVYDLWGEVAARRTLPIMAAIGFGFFCITYFWTDSFLIFIVYEAVAMIFALGAYLWLAYKKRLVGAWLVAAGIFVTILAAVAQASNVISFTFIWSFDHNGVYHLLQMPGVILLVTGLRKGLHSRV